MKNRFKAPILAAMILSVAWLAGALGLGDAGAFTLVAALAAAACASLGSGARCGSCAP